MTLGVLSVLIKPKLVPITAENLAWLDQIGARGFIDIATREMPRARARLWFLGLMLLFLAFAASALHWSGPGLLAFVLIRTAITVGVELVTRLLAAPWLDHSLEREYTIAEMLALARSVGSASEWQPPRAPKPLHLTLSIACACTVLGLSSAWFLMRSFGWVSWDAVVSNANWVPAVLLLGFIHMALGLFRARRVKRTPMGVNLLDNASDEALDVFALSVILAILLLPLGEYAILVIPFLVVQLELVFWSYRYWWQRQSLQLLGQFVRGRQVELATNELASPEQVALDDF